MKTVEQYADQLDDLERLQPRLTRGDLQMILIEVLLDNPAIDHLPEVRNVVAAGYLLSERLAEKVARA